MGEMSLKHEQNVSPASVSHKLLLTTLTTKTNPQYFLCVDRSQCWRAMWRFTCYSTFKPSVLSQIYTLSCYPLLLLWTVINFIEKLKHSSHLRDGNQSEIVFSESWAASAGVLFLRKNNQMWMLLLWCEEKPSKPSKWLTIRGWNSSSPL